MYRSYSLNNMPQPINTSTNIPPPPPENIIKKKEEKNEIIPEISGLKSDDIILLIVIGLLIFNECNDKLLLLALIYIFFSDYFNH